MTPTTSLMRILHLGTITSDGKRSIRRIEERAGAEPCPSHLWLYPGPEAMQRPTRQRHRPCRALLAPLALALAVSMIPTQIACRKNSDSNRGVSARPGTSSSAQPNIAASKFAYFPDLISVTG